MEALHAHRVPRQACRAVVLLASMLFPAHWCRLQAKAPPLPAVSPETGTRLTTLAREAMRSFLHTRIDGDAMALPDEFRAAASTKVDAKGTAPPGYAVELTLRQKHVIVGRGTGAGGSLPRNVVGAALVAMRSPSLPDKVTDALLKSLRLELEILGPEIRVPTPDIAKTIVPGRYGLTLSVGVPDQHANDRSPSYRQTRLLPSRAYILGLDADGMRKKCVTGTRLSAAIMNLKPNWSLFSTLHFVEYPGKRAWLLYRGKIVRTDDMLQKMSSTAARDTAGFLISNYRKGKGISLSRGTTTLSGRLHAAAALKRIAGTTGGETPGFRACGEAELIHIARHHTVFRKDTDTAFVATQDRRHTIMPTALFILAANTPPRKSESAAVTASMLRYLGSAADTPGGRFREQDGTPASPAATAAGTAAILGAGSPDKDGKIERLIENLVTPGGKGAVLDTDTLAWCVRGICLSDTAVRKRLMYHLPKLCRQLLERQSRRGVAIDERGGFRRGDGLSTVTTGLAVAALRGAVPLLEEHGVDTARHKESIVLGRRYLKWAVYLPWEAYFIADPATMIGAARETPRSATVSVAACAAAIEGLMKQE